jgi:hypothetical protein
MNRQMRFKTARKLFGIASEAIWPRIPMKYLCFMPCFTPNRDEILIP